MKNLVIILAGLLVISVVVSGLLWRDLRTERLAAATIGTPDNPPNGSLAIAQPTPLPDAPIAEATVPSPQDEVSLARKRVVEAARSAAPSFRSSEEELMKNPEYRNAERTQLRLTIAKRYPGLAVALGLSENEVNQIFEAMAENHLKARDTAGGAAAHMIDMVTGASGHEDKLRAALGEAKHGQYEEYRQNVQPALMWLESLNGVLASAGMPLSESQSRSLTAVLVAEQWRQRSDAAALRSTPAPAVSTQSPGATSGMQHFHDLNARRIIDASTPYLNSAQAEFLQRHFDQQSSAIGGYAKAMDDYQEAIEARARQP